MADIDSYLIRKAAAMNARREDWTAARQAGDVNAGIVNISASSKLAGITGARPTQMGDHRIVSDSAPGMAGHALGPTAPEMLLGALASCLVHTYVIQAILLEVPLDSVEVFVSGKLDMGAVIGMDMEKVSTIEDMRYYAEIASPASSEALDWLHAAVEAACPVLNTLKLAGTVLPKAPEPAG